MKGLILSGGRGTRLRPITYTGAKQLVPVANKPVLFYAIEALAAAGIHEIGIIVGDTAAEVRRAVGDGSRWGVQISYIPQETPAGLAHAVHVARPFLADDPFIMYLGDNLIRDSLTPLVESFRREPADAWILLSRVPHPEQFGVAVFDEQGRVQRLIEKPAVPPSDYALVGVYLFSPAIHQAVAAIRPSPRGELEITDAIQWLIDTGRSVRPQVITGWWKDTGKKDDMLEANRIILDDLVADVAGTVEGACELAGRISLAPTAIIRNSTVRGPVIIGEGAVIEDAYIGPYTAIGDRVVVRQSEIEHSIVLDGAQILDIGGRLEDSLIGRDVLVRRGQSKPHSFKLMLGDHSQIELI
ncbi:MAG: glucose-1-phosphate thymidylyltransferase [Candidatus Sericytochromatia bacterium]|nr:glucose-1-phosphate thymidylyltransferase [Candidatus Sericytochromatia bacterium]